jgi:hypothetical protein
MFLSEEVNMNTDEDGYILPHGGNEMVESIVFLGGSTTECIEVNDHKRFPYLVGELLPETKCKTINAGVSSNNT